MHFGTNLESAYAMLTLYLVGFVFGVSAILVLVPYTVH